MITFKIVFRNLNSRTVWLDSVSIYTTHTSMSVELFILKHIIFNQTKITINNLFKTEQKIEKEFVFSRKCQGLTLIDVYI